jgi:hypothetical protein
MKTKDYKEMMSYLTRREPAYDKAVNMNKFNKDLVKAKQNAYKTLSPDSPDKLLNFIDKFKKGDPKTWRFLSEYDPNKKPKPKYMVNPTTNEYERIDQDYLAAKLVDDQLFQMKDGFITNKAGESLPTLKDAINRNDKLEAEFEPKEFENILKRLKKKNTPKKQTVQPTLVADKSKPIEPPIVPYDYRTNPNWWDLSDDDAPKPKPPTEETMLNNARIREDMAGLKEGIGTLFLKKNR